MCAANYHARIQQIWLFQISSSTTHQHIMNEVILQQISHKKDIQISNILVDVYIQLQIYMRVCGFQSSYTA